MLYKAIKREWSAVEVNLRKPAVVRLFDGETQTGTLLCESVLYCSISGGEKMLSFGRYYKTRRDIRCSILAFPVNPYAGRDMFTAKGKIECCGKEYAESILLYASGDEICVSTGVMKERQAALKAALDWAMQNYGIIASDQGGLLYQNPDHGERFFYPMLRAICTQLGK